MPTNCQFTLENTDFDHLDESLVDGQLQCHFPHYDHGNGCPSCPVYRQLFENKNATFEETERVQEEIQKWWT